MRVKGQIDEEATVQMAPLIDCVFLLLIFFLVAATLKKAHNEVDIRVADAAVATEPSPDHTPFVIEIRGDGKFYLKGEHVGPRYISLAPVTPQVVQERLRELAAENPEQVIRIDGDRRTAFQHIVRLMDICKFEGIKNVKLRTGD